ncbi:hypothetical protein DPMN_050008 [Dreissena polymorpha]|uniref:Uncharacterized protein n=1 Tax=Dreissena polymorpha TaxID=45954 RepID=A0A9D4HMN7_DREPO|nr:hypothetical protein DPMN_050008 [Dreissena polymorpha]
MFSNGNEHNVCRNKMLTSNAIEAVKIITFDRLATMQISQFHLCNLQRPMWLLLRFLSWGKLILFTLMLLL